MLVDSFLAFDEIELALFRIDFLSEYVDKVIIAESELTHSGIKKPLYFKDYFSNHNRELSRKVELVSLDLSRYSDSWSREIASRELLIKHIFQNYPNSFFINSDLDEVPSLETIDMLENSTQNFYHFSTKTYYRYANWALQDSHQNWNKGVVGYTGGLEPVNGGRFVKYPIIASKIKGAHFSYVGRKHKSFSQKLESFAHTELNRSELKSSKFLDFADLFAIDHLGRSREASFGLLKVIPKSQLDLMQCKLLEQYPDFFSFPRHLHHPFRRFIASVAITIIVNGYCQNKGVYKFVIEKERTFATRISYTIGISLEVLVSTMFLFRRIMLRLMRL